MHLHTQAMKLSEKSLLLHPDFMSSLGFLHHAQQVFTLQLALPIFYNHFHSYWNTLSLALATFNVKLICMVIVVQSTYKLLDTALCPSKTYRHMDKQKVLCTLKSALKFTGAITYKQRVHKHWQSAECIKPVHHQQYLPSLTPFCNVFGQLYGSY